MCRPWSIRIYTIYQVPSSMSRGRYMHNRFIFSNLAHRVLWHFYFAKTHFISWRTQKFLSICQQFCHFQYEWCRSLHFFPLHERHCANSLLLFFCFVLFLFCFVFLFLFLLLLLFFVFFVLFCFLLLLLLFCCLLLVFFFFVFFCLLLLLFFFVVVFFCLFVVVFSNVQQW